MTTVISVEHLSKAYRLGQIGTGTFAHDLNVWWAKVRGKPNPLLRIGETDHGNRDGERIWALKDVSFTVGQGEVLGIIGRNGAGKSTLLKILSRVTAPTSGQVKIKGRIASLLEVGTGFHPELTGRENIYLNGAILGMSRREIDRKFDEIVDFSGVEQFIDTPIKRYSSGMYVRLAFAVAAHLDPEILVVDEVLAVGDAEFQKKCLRKMGGVAKEGRTVLFVSHNMGAILNLCPQTILLASGNIIANGATADIFQSYLSNGVYDDVENQFYPSRAVRAGDARVRIIDFKVEPLQPQTGLPARFTFKVQASETVRFEAAVSINSKEDVPLLQIFSRDSDTVFNIDKGEIRKITVELPILPMVPGRYNVNLWLGLGSMIFDWIKDAFTLSVFSGYFKENVPLSTKNYPLILPGVWSKENLENGQA